MKRYNQTYDEIISKLSVLKSSWKDEHAEAVIEKLNNIPKKDTYTTQDVETILDIEDGIFKGKSESKRFDVGITVIRMFLDVSKDECTAMLKAELGDLGIGIKSWKKDREKYLSVLKNMGILNALNDAINKPVTWKNIIEERLKGGRGSAIKGQKRGRELEDWVEEKIKIVFKDNFETRCRFAGASGQGTEKCDFAILNAKDPSILIEVKGYGATGSKQTDVLGDITRIVNEKRPDTNFLLFTDGTTWKERGNDLKKIIEMQNKGDITKIYTKKMEDEFINDLKQLKQDHCL